MFGSFGGMEFIVIILIVLLLFGAKKIPELARGIGQGIQEFKKASGEIRKEIEKGSQDVDDLKNMNTKENDTTKINK